MGARPERSKTIMFHHAFPFHVDGANYRLVVAERLFLCVLEDGMWRDVPANQLKDLILRLVKMEEGVTGYGFRMTVMSARICVSLCVEYGRWRRIWKRPLIRVQILNLGEMYPWVDNHPEALVEDLPILFLGDERTYQRAHPIGLWALWAILTHHRHLPIPWPVRVEVADQNPSGPPQISEEDN